MVPAILSCLFLLALDVRSLTEGDKFGVTWLTFILYGLSVIPFAYFTSFMFKDPGNASVASFFLNYGFGYFGSLIMVILKKGVWI